ncbi:hypothetical protein ACQ9BO_07800 [Flavobacterium sp. P21]|uniref:hypothetical protein n=1 Tax=Flavobacterium sp. P21 TaxID=3423948 RepID=UPI003D66AD9E
MKAIDNEGLQLISEIVIQKINTSGIYCFGEKKQIQVVQNPFQESVSNQKEHTHFYLLVITNEIIDNATADIADIVREKTGGRYTVTLLLHKATSLRHLAPSKLHFFHEVLTKSQIVFEHVNFPPSVAFAGQPKRNLDSMRSHWNNRKKIAEVYLKNESQVDRSNAQIIQESMLHTSVEQICLGLIDLFLSYQPNHFATAYLFEICEVFTPITSEIFPQTTKEDKKLFDLLKAHPNKLRWATLKTSDFLNTEILERRCNLFQERASELVESELNRLENIQLKLQEP